jgi:hypothetical protein
LIFQQRRVCSVSFQWPDWLEKLYLVVSNMQSILTSGFWSWPRFENFRADKQWCLVGDRDGWQWRWPATVVEQWWVSGVTVVVDEVVDGSGSDCGAGGWQWWVTVVGDNGGWQWRVTVSGGWQSVVSGGW